MAEPQTFESFTPEQIAFFKRFAQMNEIGRAGEVNVPAGGTVTTPAEQWPPQHVQELMAPPPVPSLFQDTPIPTRRTPLNVGQQADALSK